MCRDDAITGTKRTLPQEKVSCEHILVDSGTSVHIERNLDRVKQYVVPNRNPSIRVRGIDATSLLRVTHTGFIPNLGVVYVVPDCDEDLLSVPQLRSLGHSVIFEPRCAFIKMKDGRQVACGQHQSGLVAVTREGIYNCVPPGVAYVTKRMHVATRFTAEQQKRAEQVKVLHNALDHPSDEKLIDCLNYGVITGTHLTARDVVSHREIHGPCLACLAGKSTKPSYGPSLQEPAIQSGEIVHVDLFQPPEQTIGGYNYYLLAVDEYSGYMSAQPLNFKSNACLQLAFYSLLGVFKCNKIMIQNIHSDHEATLWSCKDYLAHQGVRLQQTTPYQHAQRIERYVRTIKMKMRTTLAALPYELPKNLYGELLQSVIYNMNDIPTAMFPTASPRMLVEGRRLELGKRQLVPFGQVVMLSFPGKEQDKYLPRSVPGVVLGPGNDRCYGSMRCYILYTKAIVTRTQISPLATFPVDFPWSCDRPNLATKGEEDILKRVLGQYVHTGELHEPSDACMFPSSDPDAAESEYLSQSPSNDAINLSDDSSDTSETRSSNSLEQHSLSGRTTHSRIPRSRKYVTRNTSSQRTTRKTPSAPAERSIAPTQSCNKLQSNPREKAHANNPPVTNVYNDRPQRQARRNWKDGPARMAAHFARTYRLSITKALSGDRAQDSVEAIKDEILNMITYKVGHYIHRSDIARDKLWNVIHAFVFLKHKTKPDGTYDKTKARMVANGKRQKAHMYDLISSSTVSLTTVMLLINIASRDNALLASYDVKGAFLHAKFGDKDEITYLRIPADITKQWVIQDPSCLPFVDEKGELTLELDKFIYGLKQSPYKFQQHLNTTLKAAGYVQQALDECLFSKWSGDKYSILSTHVDDILQVTTCPKMREELQAILLKAYGDIVYHPEADSYVGLTIKRSENGGTFKLSQDGLVSKLIDQYLKNDDKSTVKSPATDTLFNTDQSVLARPVDKQTYLSLVMSLMYVARLSRPDILQPVTYLATRSHMCNTDDWKACLRVLRFLRETREDELTIRCNSLDLHLICDASYAVHSDHKSHTGYAITVGSNHSFITARSAKQKLVSQSSTEAEVYAMVDCLKQAYWIREIIRSLSIAPLAPITMYQDNKSAIIMTTGDSKFRNSKHVLTKIAYARELKALGILDVVHMPTDLMWADMLTKPMHGEPFQRHRASLLGMHEREVLAAYVLASKGCVTNCKL
jgi:hypothetical protein